MTCHFNSHHVVARKLFEVWNQVDWCHVSFDMVHLGQRGSVRFYFYRTGLAIFLGYIAKVCEYKDPKEPKPPAEEPEEPTED